MFASLLHTLSLRLLCSELSGFTDRLDTSLLSGTHRVFWWLRGPGLRDAEDLPVKEALPTRSRCERSFARRARGRTTQPGPRQRLMHEFEDAISDCLAGDIWDNEETSDAGDSPHAWDEGWAFLAGSLEGVDGSGSGQMLYQLAQKRCADFGTCVSGTSGEAKANLKALAYAEQGRDKILDGDCVTVQYEFDEIVKQLTIPLVQGMLKYAFKSDPANSQGSCTSGSCPKEWAEGWAFAAAVLPQVHECDHTVASMIVANLDVMNSDPMSENGFEEFKESVESVYSCMGITCADMGEFQNTAGVYAGMDACVDGSGTVTSSSSSDDDDDVDGIPVVIVIILAAVALILLVAIVLFFQWRKTETKLYELVANGDKASNNML